jgi:hypothetical protein
MHQENSVIHLENVDTINFSKTHLLSDQISPEHTGIPKQLPATPEGLLRDKIYNEPNYLISTEFLLALLNYKFRIIGTRQNITRK